MRAKSAQSHNKLTTLNEMDMLDEELSHQIKKSSLLDGDRKQFWRQAEDVKEKNKEQIERLKSQNERLKQMRDELTGTKKIVRGVTTNSFGGNDLRDENFWRRQLDKEKYISTNKKKALLELQNLLREVEDSKTGYIEESPLMKTIRILENRLDKVMIKYNEAQSIKKTYEQIVKRLKEERVGYDNQLAAIQRSLKGKQHDFEELLLLAHDATHAKEVAYNEYRKFDQKRLSIQELRAKYLDEKKGDVEKKKQIPCKQPTAEKQNRPQPKERQINPHEVINQREKSNYQREDLIKYEQALRKLKEVTGVLDSNEIIQKHKTQQLTANSLEQLQKQYQSKILRLKQAKSDLKEQLTLKLSKSDRNCDRQYINKLQNQVQDKETHLDNMKVKHQKMHQLLVGCSAGFEHLNKHLDFFRVDEGWNKALPSSSTTDQLLHQFTKKVEELYALVKNDPDYSTEYFKQSIVNVEEILIIRGKDMNQHLSIQRNNRLKNFKDADQMSDRNYDDEVGLDSSMARHDTKNSSSGKQPLREQSLNMRKTISRRK